MRQRNVKNQDEILKTSDKYVSNPESLKGKWKASKYKEVHLEIGIGKGSFIIKKARRHKDVLFIGIEINKGVASLAIKKIARYEKEIQEKITNLKIAVLNALELESIFCKNEINKIYLNFSDPWPKARHEKRRLTSDSFLFVYKNILKVNSIIEMKTDNKGLFEYTIENINKNKVQILYITSDLYKDIADGNFKEQESNIVTEYEERFSKLGPIYKIIFKL